MRILGCGLKAVPCQPQVRMMFAQIYLLFGICVMKGSRFICCLVYMTFEILYRVYYIPSIVKNQLCRRHMSENQIAVAIQCLLGNVFPQVSLYCVCTKHMVKVC